MLRNDIIYNKKQNKRKYKIKESQHFKQHWQGILLPQHISLHIEHAAFIIYTNYFTQPSAAEKGMEKWIWKS